MDYVKQRSAFIPRIPVSDGSMNPCEKFNGENAMDYVKQQLAFGPRIPGSDGSIAAQNFIQKEMEISGWIVEKQKFLFGDTSITNIIAKSSNNLPKVIIGTHYDTRAFSDNEPSPSLQSVPVPGGNDGASGTAIILELGKILEKSKIDAWLVFFDAEDQGNINGWEWSLGAQYFVDHLIFPPDNVLIIDMVGDANLEIYRELNSSTILTESIWIEAEKLGHDDIFIQTDKFSIFDDHIPFINKEISASLIIDINYPYWHLTSDTADKVSSTSLETVGQVVLSWLENKYY